MLAILQNGANDATAAEISGALGSHGLSFEELGDRNRRLLDQLDSANSGVQLTIASSLWVSQKYPITSNFLADARRNYHAEAQNLGLFHPPCP